MNIVWFKRDLRGRDHEALRLALEAGPCVGLFVIEPEWLQSDGFSWDHLRFALEGLQDLIKQLNVIGVSLLVRQGRAEDVLSNLHRQHPIKALFSHEETGLLWSYQRDLRVQDWCRLHSIPWTECRQFGVVRCLKDRRTWPHKRTQIVERPLHQITGQTPRGCPWSVGELPWDLLQGQILKTKAQLGGSFHAHHLLSSFLEERGIDYFKSISSPVLAFDSCSRLSPYLAWGQMSLTEIYWALQHKRRSLVNEIPELRWRWMRSLKNFESRLWWHCHFIQKLETEPNIEFYNFNRQFDGLRESEWDESKFQAWCRGETGFPMIDACMRALHQHGWINFRMRAMLMSFSSYQLWLHWKKPAVFLARHFLDFEPGIHYSQAQMQSGVTGINTIRIYSPAKQQVDQDPQGKFIRDYLPELSSIPDADLAEPHKMPPLLQISSGFRIGIDYPEPIVDPVASYQTAKQRIFEWKARDATRKAAKKVVAKHTS